MEKTPILREVTPLTVENCFIYISRTKKEFTYPVHTHPEYELNFIENAKGVKRIVGDSIEEIDDLELVLITGANLEHVWTNGNCTSESIQEITIQFHPDLFSSTLPKYQFRTIKTMFERASNGLVFSAPFIRKVKQVLLDLGEETGGFTSFIKFLSLMYELSLDKNSRVLSSSVFANTDEATDSRRIKKVLAYMLEHYREPVRLADAAELAGMGEMSFTRFFKLRTGKTFVEYLNGIRLGMAARLLVDTTTSINEICYECGFNNLSNFNRMFKKAKNCTPKEFRENYYKKRILV